MSREPQFGDIYEWRSGKQKVMVVVAKPTCFVQFHDGGLTQLWGIIDGDRNLLPFENSGDVPNPWVLIDES